MGNDVLIRPRGPEERRAWAERSAERTLAPRYSAYVGEIRRLIEAGLVVMRKSGGVDPRVGEIVREAGLSNQAFYRHFKSKDELLLAILDDGTRELEGYLEHRMASAATPLERVRRWVEGMVAQATHARAADATRPFVVHRARLAERFPDDIARATEVLVAPLRRALDEASEAGALIGCEPALDAAAIHQLAMGWMESKLLERSAPSAAEAGHIVDFALRGLRREPRREGGERGGA